MTQELASNICETTYLAQSESKYGNIWCLSGAYCESMGGTKWELKDDAESGLSNLYGLM